MENNLEINLNGNYTNIFVKNQKLKHSMFFSLILKNQKKNIESEIKRIKKDIRKCEAAKLLSNNFDKSLSIITSSKNSNEAVKKLKMEYSIKESDAKFYINLSIKEVNKIDFNLIKLRLIKYITFLEDLNDIY